MLVTVTGETGTHTAGQVLDLPVAEARWLLARRYAVAERRAPDPPETAKADRPVEDR